VHSSSDGSGDKIDVPLYVANGVTTVREMWGHPYLHDWRRRVDAGTLLGPRFVIGSAIIDGSPTLWNDPAARPSAPIVVANAAEARRAVRQSKQDGADFIKIYSRLTKDAFNGIVDEAQRQRLPVAGHCPDMVPLAAASDAGMWSFEHLDGAWWLTTSRQSAIWRGLKQIKINPADAYGSWFQQIGVLEWEAATTYRSDIAERLFARLRRNQSWQVPTLTMYQNLDLPGSDYGDPRLKYVSAGTAAFWKMWADARKAERTPAEVAEHRALFGLRQQLVLAMHSAGVPLLAGTDTGTTYLYPGFSLHDELALLVDAGIPPMDALRAATYDAARFLGLQKSQGAVHESKTADLVVLDADPIADIRNTQRIDAVVVGGRLITAAQRQQLLDGAAKTANPPGAPAAAVAPRAGCGCAAHSA